MEAPVAFIGLKPAHRPFFVASGRIDIKVSSVFHQHFHQATTNKSCSSCDKNILSLQPFPRQRLACRHPYIIIVASHSSLFIYFNQLSFSTCIKAFKISRSSTVVTLIFFSEPGTMCISLFPSSAIRVHEATELVIPFFAASS